MSRVFFIVSILFFCQQSYSQQKTAIKPFFNLENGIALKQYDPVSYFTGMPLKGNKEVNYTFRQVTYCFYNKANLETFKKNPEKYEPAYGGWCAYAMGNDGSLVEVDPETYKILNGRLYLFYNFYLTNTLKKWNLNESGLKMNADKNWDKILNFKK